MRVYCPWHGVCSRRRPSRVSSSSVGFVRFVMGRLWAGDLLRRSSSVELQVRFMAMSVGGRLGPRAIPSPSLQGPVRCQNQNRGGRFLGWDVICSSSDVCLYLDSGVRHVLLVVATAVSSLRRSEFLFVFSSEFVTRVSLVSRRTRLAYALLDLDSSLSALTKSNSSPRC